MRFSLLLIVALLPYNLVAQSLGDQRVAWGGRIENLKSRAIQEAEKSDPLHRAHFYARLGDLWWELDKTQSSSWFEKAVDTLIYKADPKNEEERANYLQNAREVLKIISVRSPKQTERLINLLMEADKISEKDRNTNADILIEFALLFVKDDPKKAFDIASLAFRNQQPSNFHRLYWELRRKDGALADRFFKIAIASARHSPTSRVIATVKAGVFPELLIQGSPESLRSPALIRAETLQFFSDFLIQMYAKVLNKSVPSCEAEAFQFSALKPEVDGLVSQRAALFSQAINGCLAAADQAKKDLASFRPANTNNVDELVKLAAEAKDNRAKAYYLFRAANVANSSNNYRRAIEILDDMDGEIRSYDPKFWEELRYTSSAGRAHQQVMENDFAGAIGTLNRVSVEYRAFANVGFALKFSSGDAMYEGIVLEQLQEAANLIEKSELPFMERSEFWFKILETYAQRQRFSNSAETFKAIARGFNKAVSEEKSKPVLGVEKIKASISPDLLESQDAALIDSANSITDLRSRLDSYLGMLGVAVKYYSALIKEPINSVTSEIN